MNERSAAKALNAAGADKVLRHALIDRIEHWLMAICVLVLLGTAFLPIFGVDFAWVDIHWITGIVLIIAVLIHIARSVFWKSLMSMWLGAADLRDLIGTARWNLRQTDREPAKPGKYTVAQKLIHHGFAVAVLTTMVTGACMLAKIDTPWWQRNPYFLSDPTWGIVYVLHGVAALLLIAMVKFRMSISRCGQRKYCLRVP